MRFLNKKGQSIAEYSILIALVIAAAIGIQTYVKRGWQGRAKDASDGLVQTIVDRYTDCSTSNELGDTVAIQENQFEPESVARRSTQETLVDTANYDLAVCGTTRTDIIRTTQANVGDYQAYTYNTVNP